MRKNLAGIGVLICFAFMLLFPKDVFNGASKGLLLWFHTVFPTLFPFLIITNLLMSTNCIRLIARLFGPLLNKIFRVSPNGSFAIIAGFLCGYPMGAKNFRRPDTYKTDFTAGRSVSTLLLQQYKSGLYFQFCSLENTGKKRTDDSVHPDPDSCAHSGQLFYEKNVFEGKTGISGSGFRLAEKYVLVL